MKGLESLKNLKEYAIDTTNALYFGPEKIFAIKDLKYIEEQSYIIQKDLERFEQILTYYKNADGIGFNETLFFKFINDTIKERENEQKN